MQVPAHGSNRENEGATSTSLLKRQGPPQDSNHGSSDASLEQDNENPWDLSMFNDMELDQVIIKHHPKNLQVINVIV
jgi:hypothetical protein